MKAILSFNLPEEKNQHTLALRGSDFYFVLLQIDEQLRAWQKYGPEFESGEAAIQAVRELIVETLDEYGVGLEFQEIGE